MKADVKTILANMKKGQYMPVYVLHGEEPFYIDQVADYVEQHAIDESLKDFNQTIFYGKDADVEAIRDAAMRMPMMSERQLVLVREAQDLRGKNDLLSYIKNPSPTTVLVFEHKYGKWDGRSAIMKTMVKSDKVAVIQSDKVADYKLNDWLQQFLKQEGFTTDYKAVQLMAEFLGNDLTKIHNEVEKLKLILGEDKNLKAEHIEKHIGVSKEYNIFELNNALGERNRTKAYRIVQYFAANPKAIAIPMAIGNLYQFFTKVLITAGYAGYGQAALAKVLKLPPMVAGFYRTYAQHYNANQLQQVFKLLADYDLRSKGVGNTNRMDAGQLLTELVIKILNV